MGNGKGRGPYHWAGIRPVARDRQPIMGLHSRYKQLAIFNGLGSKGVLQAPFRAKQMRKLLTIKYFELPNEDSVGRFLRLGSTLIFGKFNFK